MPIEWPPLPCVIALSSRRRPAMRWSGRMRPVSRRLIVLAGTVVLCCSRRALAQVGTGELAARLSFLLLVLLGAAQIVIAAKARPVLSRSRTAMTALIALSSCGVGILVAVADAGAHAIGAIQAVLAFLPGLPVAIDLGRQRSW